MRRSSNEANHFCSVRTRSLALRRHAFSGAQALQVDAGLPPYQKVSGVSGSLSSIGSDTMNNMMTLWAETFRKMYPNVKIQVEGKGSTTAPAGAASPAPRSSGRCRARCAAAEIDQFEAKYGYKPTQLQDVVRRARGLRQQGQPDREADARAGRGHFLARRRKRGYKEDVKTWGQLGLTGDWASRPISLYGRNSASGTYGFFKEHALKNGDYKTTVKEQPGSASVVQGVDRGSLRHRLQRHRLQDVGRQGRAARRDRQGHVLRRLLRRRDGRQVSAVALPLHLREQGAGQAARSARRRSS